MDRFKMPFEVLKMKELKQYITPSLIKQAKSTYRNYQNVSEEPQAMEQREETLPKEAA